MLVSSPSDFSPPGSLARAGLWSAGLAAVTSVPAVPGGGLGGRRAGRAAARSVAAQSRCPAVGGAVAFVVPPSAVLWAAVQWAAVAREIPGRDLQRERTAGALQLFLRGLVVADDPVARRRPIGAPGPPNKPDAGEKGLLCHPGGWGGAESGGGVVAVPGSRPHPGHPPARPGSGPIPGTAVAVAVLVVVAASAVGLVGLRAGGRREGTSGRMQLLVRSPGRCGRPPSLGSWAPRAPMMRESGHRGLGLANGRDRREAASAFDVGELPRIHPEEGRDFILQGLRKCATLSGSRGPRITQGCAPR